MMRTPELIATHTNTDFDAFAAMVAARKLYPEAALCLGGAVNRNVREFQALYADLIPVLDPGDVDRASVRRLIVVDTVHANRLGDLADICERDDVQVVAFDHHSHEGDLPSFITPDNLVSSADGSLVTLLVGIVAERGIPITPFEATVFALGIHEDTGSLTFATTTAHDAEALALCMQRGADTALLEKWLTNALTSAQRHTLAAALEAAEELPIAAATVLLSALRQDLYVEGVSVVAHRVMDLTGCDAFFLLVAMENRVFVTARSRGNRVDVARVLASVGGGGHAAAASAVVKDTALDEVATAVAAAVPAAVAAVRTVRDVLLSAPPPLELDTSVDEAALRCRRLRLGGMLVADGQRLAGTVALGDLERAVAHGLGHAPVKAVMSSYVTVIEAGLPLERAAAIVSQEEIGWAPVVAGPAPAVRSAHGGREVLRGSVIGAVARGVVGGAAGTSEPPVPVAANLAGALGELGLDALLREIQGATATVRGVYLVGGAVRDLLLGEPGFDIDIAVEGDGIALAHDLAARLHGHVRPHEKFGTAVVVGENARGGRQRVDVASTRSESYEHPAALPKVEHAGIRSDLARRDFTINAMAVSLKPESYGDLLDFYGGLGDLEARRIVVLHNLSFIEDPTRILRAIRYENRYGLRMDEHTLNLARACCAMDLVGDLSSARLRDELIALLDEEKVDFSLKRLEDLELASSIHGRLSVDNETRDLVRRGERTRRLHHLEEEMPRWRSRLVWLLRELEPEEISTWTQRMHMRRVDAEVLERALVVARRLVDRVSHGPSEADLFELARYEPLEAVVTAMVLDHSGVAAERLGRFLDVTRHVRLEIRGDDLLALGFTPSPEMGDVLRSVLHFKLNGVVHSRADELSAAEKMRRGK
jgi:tRNA nucleotidyltransferase (CCA-adding enzyme)